MFFSLCHEFPIPESLERLRMCYDPNIEMCYFELYGICNDKECP